MEKEWAKQLRAGNEVEVEIFVAYGDDGTTPIGFQADTRINNGEIDSRTFTN